MTRTFTLDLHVHTNYSVDGHDTVERIIAVARARGLDGLAICDHNTIAGVQAARDYVTAHDLDFLIIPGEEVSTAQGHLLVLGLEEVIARGMSVRETIRAVRHCEHEHAQSVLIIAPHPYHPFRNSIGNICIHPEIAAIEVFNSRYFTGIGNWWAQRTAKRTAKIAVAGSDAHSADCVGLATVAVDADVEAARMPDHRAIMQSLKGGRVHVQARERTPFRLYLSQLCKKKQRVG
ncbi:MAG TPA: PHP domain-containing protein [Methanomicrobia archaeon]|nr:PHP domain-containing protein [Methanomicrobia archaeon]